MRRIAAVVGLGVGALILGGCPPTYPKCESDAQCKDKGEYCVQGQCQQCATDQHCQAGFICQSQKCVPKPECTTDATCPGGRKCQAGKCTLPEGACGSDADCKAGGKCRNNACLEPGACVDDGDCTNDQSCSAGRCAPKEDASARCEWEAIPFEFNEYSLNSEARSKLDSLVDCIKKQGGTLTLAGHADERGTEEYNLQLSNRRAEAVRKYLADLGVGDTRLKVVGYGETQPKNSGSNEGAWSENRRVEFESK